MGLGAGGRRFRPLPPADQRPHRVRHRTELGLPAVATVPATCRSDADCTPHPVPTSATALVQSSSRPGRQRPAHRVLSIRTTGSSNRPLRLEGDIWTMRWDGQDRKAAVDSRLFEYEPSWGPAAATTTNAEQSTTRANVITVRGRCWSTLDAATNGHARRGPTPQRSRHELEWSALPLTTQSDQGRPLAAKCRSTPRSAPSPSG
jgi:hypothetical protein